MDVSTAFSLLQSALLSQAPESGAAAAAATFTGADLRVAAGVLAAALAISFGVIGAGLGEGYATGRACESISRNPQAGNTITRTMLIGIAIVESTAIYALLIALLILLYAV